MEEMAEREKLILKHGGYRKLKSFQVAQLVYDVTVRFTERYIDRFSRSRDQMVQAARSGVQNIAEGSQASGTSKKTELKLTNVARSSLEELRLDYGDFLRQRGLCQWQKDDPRKSELIARRPKNADEVAEWVKKVYENGPCFAQGATQGRCNGLNGPKETSTKSISSKSSSYPEIAANAALTLIAVAGSLLDRQLAAQAQFFEKEGGFTERLYRVRQQSRKTKINSKK
jgi:four helix bundle suffix protein